VLAPTARCTRRYIPARGGPTNQGALTCTSAGSSPGGAGQYDASRNVPNGPSPPGRRSGQEATRVHPRGPACSPPGDRRRSGSGHPRAGAVFCRRSPVATSMVHPRGAGIAARSSSVYTGASPRGLRPGGRVALGSGSSGARATGRRGGLIVSSSGSSPRAGSVGAWCRSSAARKTAHPAGVWLSSSADKLSVHGPSRPGPTGSCRRSVRRSPAHPRMLGTERTTTSTEQPGMGPSPRAGAEPPRAPWSTPGLGSIPVRGGSAACGLTNCPMTRGPSPCGGCSHRGTAPVPRRSAHPPARGRTTTWPCTRSRGWVHPLASGCARLVLGRSTRGRVHPSRRGAPSACRHHGHRLNGPSPAGFVTVSVERTHATRRIILGGVARTRRLGAGPGSGRAHRARAGRDRMAGTPVIAVHPLARRGGPVDSCAVFNPGPSPRGAVPWPLTRAVPTAPVHPLRGPYAPARVPPVVRGRGSGRRHVRRIIPAPRGLPAAGGRARSEHRLIPGSGRCVAYLPFSRRIPGPSLRGAAMPRTTLRALSHGAIPARGPYGLRYDGEHCLRGSSRGAGAATTQVQAGAVERLIPCPGACTSGVGAAAAATGSRRGAQPATSSPTTTAVHPAGDVEAAPWESHSRVPGHPCSGPLSKERVSPRSWVGSSPDGVRRAGGQQEAIEAPRIAAKRVPRLTAGAGTNPIPGPSPRGALSYDGGRAAQRARAIPYAGCCQAAQPGAPAKIGASPRGHHTSYGASGNVSSGSSPRTSDCLPAAVHPPRLGRPPLRSDRP